MELTGSRARFVPCTKINAMQETLRTGRKRSFDSSTHNVQSEFATQSDFAPHLPADGSRIRVDVHPIRVMRPILIGFLLEYCPDNLDGIGEQVQVLSNASKLCQRIQRVRSVCDISPPRFPENDGLHSLIG